MISGHKYILDGVPVTVDDCTTSVVFFHREGERTGQRSLPYAKFYCLSAPLKINPEANTAGGMKYDGDKPRMDLLLSGCPNALEAVSSILTFGAKKYAAHSWQTVPQGDERYLAALLRHLTAVGKGETLDSESGMLHLAHAACNALFILELELRKGVKDGD